MPLKTTTDGAPVLVQGAPVWVDDQGRETPVDLPRLLQAEDALRQRDTQLHELLVRAAFDHSAFLREQTFLPPDMAYACFAHHFTIEEHQGRLTPIARLDREIIPSPTRPGQPATPDEALQHLLYRHPQRDRVLKAGHPGGPGGQGNRNPEPTLRAWSRMTLDEQARYVEQYGAAAAKALIDQSA
jgi:hypothetical protein